MPVDLLSSLEKGSALSAGDYHNTLLAIERSIRVSAKHFAAGDGVTDDTSNLQAGIDAVANAGGGVFYIPSGVYITSDSLLFRANVLIEGDFGGTMIEMADDANINGMFVSSGAIPFFGLRNIILNGNRNGQAAPGGFPGTSVGLRLAHSNTSPGFGGASLVGSGAEINDAYGRFENVIIVAVDGDGIQATGAACHFHNILVIGCNGLGISTGLNDGVFVDATVGGCAEEGWVCFAGSGRYYACKAFFVGTGLNANDGTFGNYANGCGFRITNRNQQFIGCEGQDTDGPAFRIQSDDGKILLSGCYSSQGCNLFGQSAAIGQNPPRGGGWAQTKSAFDIAGDDNVITGLVRDRVVDTHPADPQFHPALDCAINVRSGSDNNLIMVGGDPLVLATPGTTPWVLDNGTNTNSLHNHNG